jgi:hypothetical protein
MTSPFVFEEVRDHVLGDIHRYDRARSSSR